MSAPSDALRDFSKAATDAPVRPSPFGTLYWSIRRELWENRSIYVAPLAVAALVLFGFLISTIHLPATLRKLPPLSPMQQQMLLATPFNLTAGLLMLTAMAVEVFYCLDALHGERRDRSILFYKSLPVSDLTAVLAKASIPLAVLPLLVFAITFLLQSIMLLFGSLVAWANGFPVATLWEHLSFFRMSWLLLYHMVTVHALWYAPLFGWLFFVSAWARRAPFLWAFLPPLAIGVLEKMIFNTSHFGNMLADRLGGGVEAITASGSMPMDPATRPTPIPYLLSPGLWTGFLVAALFLAAAVRLRHSRTPG